MTFQSNGLVCRDSARDSARDLLNLTSLIIESLHLQEPAGVRLGVISFIFLHSQIILNFFQIDGQNWLKTKWAAIGKLPLCNGWSSYKVHGFM